MDETTGKVPAGEWEDYCISDKEADKHNLMVYTTDQTHPANWSIGTAGNAASYSMAALT